MNPNQRGRTRRELYDFNNDGFENDQDWFDFAGAGRRFVDVAYMPTTLDPAGEPVVQTPPS